MDSLHIIECAEKCERWLALSADHAANGRYRSAGVCMRIAMSYSEEAFADVAEQMEEAA